MTTNRLYLSRTYLCGAMDREPDGGVQWRRKITPWLNSRGIIVMDPTDKPCDSGKENSVTRAIRQDAKHNGDFSLVIDDKEVRSVDLRMVDVTDFTIVNIDLNSHPCGTYEELFWANREKKPVLVRIEQGKTQAPDWLLWTLPHEHIFSNWEDMQTYIDHIAFGKDVDRMKRWIFFKFEAITQAAINGFADLRNGV